MQNGYGRLKGRLLEVFRAVMKTGQVTRAAELLHVTPGNLGVQELVFGVLTRQAGLGVGDGLGVTAA